MDTDFSKRADDVAVNDNRITEAQIRDRIGLVEFIKPETNPHMTICVMNMKNGFSVIAHSCPVDPANYNEQLGQDIAEKKCIDQLWQLEGYLLKEKNHTG